MVIKVDMNNTLFRNASPPLTDWTPILISIAVILIALLILWIVWGYLKEWLKPTPPVYPDTFSPLDTDHPNMRTAGSDLKAKNFTGKTTLEISQIEVIYIFGSQMRIDKAIKKVGL